MKIFYDHQIFSLQDYGGISRIFTELIKGIGLTTSDSPHLSLLYSRNAHLLETGLKVSHFLKSREAIKLSNHVYNIFELATSDYTLYHPTYYDPALIKYAKGKPIVATFHDMIHEKYASQFPALKKENHVIKQKRELASKSTQMIAVSENTKKDLINLYGIAESKISVVPLASSFQNRAGNVQEGSVDPYLLFVGNRVLYKNFIPFLTAISNILKKRQVFLVCAGGGAFSDEETSVIQSLKLGNLVAQRPIDDKALGSLYSKAIAFVFPSLYEGFGIPVLEALSCGCPCILSKTSSLPEVAQNAALYFDPKDNESMANAVEEIIDNSTLREKLIKLGYERAEHFSWEKHVSQTLAVYNSVL